MGIKANLSPADISPRQMDGTLAGAINLTFSMRIKLKLFNVVLMKFPQQYVFTLTCWLYELVFFSLSLDKNINVVQRYNMAALFVCPK